jgi:hypothetical protein
MSFIETKRQASRWNTQKVSILVDSDEDLRMAHVGKLVALNLAKPDFIKAVENMRHQGRISS